MRAKQIEIICYTDDAVRDKIRNICEIQDVIRWLRIRRQAWRNHVNKMDELAKVAKTERPNTLESSRRLPRY
jgi:hypothetical protein